MTRLAKVCADRLLEKAMLDDAIWALDGDLADSYGMTEFAERLPERFIMAGIAEQNMISMAAGMAALGARPFVFSFAAFLVHRGCDQIRASLSQTGLPVALVGSHAGGCAGKNGKSHMATGDIAALRAMPDIDIFSPCDPVEAAMAMDRAATASRPCYIRAPREDCPPIAMQEHEGFRMLGDPGPPVIIASGLAVQWALQLQEALRRHSIETSVVSVWQIEPLPPGLKTIVAQARKLVVIEDHVRAGGLADAIGERCARLPDQWHGWHGNWTGSGSADTLRQLAGLDMPSMLAETLETLQE